MQAKHPSDSKRRVPPHADAARPHRASSETPLAVHASACPVEQWLEFLGHRWTAVILWHLGDGPLHYTELAARLPGVRSKALGDRLAALGARDLLERTPGTGRVRYALTAQGRDLLRVLDQLAGWAAASTPDIGGTLDAWMARPA